MTKSPHFILVKSTYTAEDFASVYIDKIVSLHGFHLSIIFDRGAQFTHIFWRSFKKGLSTKII